MDVIDFWFIGLEDTDIITKTGGGSLVSTRNLNVLAMRPGVVQPGNGQLRVGVKVVHDPENIAGPSGPPDEKIILYYETVDAEKIQYIDLATIKAFELKAKGFAGEHASLRGEHLLKNAVIKKLAERWDVHESQVGLEASKRHPDVDMKKLIEHEGHDIATHSFLKEVDIVSDLPE